MNSATPKKVADGSADFNLDKLTMAGIKAVGAASQGTEGDAAGAEDEKKKADDAKKKVVDAEAQTVKTGTE